MSPELVAAFVGGALTAIIGVAPWAMIMQARVATLSEKVDHLTAQVAKLADTPMPRCAIHDERIANLLHEVESIRVRVESLESLR